MDAVALQPVVGTPAREAGDLAPELSVVVPVHNRRHQLRQLLDALCRQDYPIARFEVLVCDDGSDEDLAGIISEAAARGLGVRWLRQQRAGPAAARNLGLAHAAGPVVAFTDSDCLPSGGWLSALADALADPRTGLVGGRIGHEGSEQLAGRCLNFLMSSSLGAAGARDPRCLVAMEFYPRAGNLAVRRELALAANGFPGSRHGEDLEFGHRIRRLGATVRFVPGAAVVHNERRTWSQILGEAYLKGRARVHLDRCCGIHQPVHALPAALVVYFVGWSFAAMLWPASAILLGIPGAAYLTMLAALALQGLWYLRDVRVVPLVPLYALTIHLGYGFGYLSGRLRPRAAQGTRPVDWQALRVTGPQGRSERVGALQS